MMLITASNADIGMRLESRPGGREKPRAPFRERGASFPLFGLLAAEDGTGGD